MGIFSWIIALILGGISVSFLTMMFQLSDRILKIQDHIRNTGDQVPRTPLMITASLAFLGTVMVLLRFVRIDILSSNTVFWVFIIGILLYLASFFTMFFIGKSYARKGFPSKPLTQTQTFTAIVACLIPFLLLLFLGKNIVKGGVETSITSITNNLNNTDNVSLPEGILILILLIIPSITGVLGVGAIGKLSTYIV